MLVKEIMKKPLVISDNISMKKAADLMEKHDVSSLIVMGNKKVLGIVTHEDIVERYAEKKKMRDVMSKPVIVIDENEIIQKAIEIIKENKISILPVLDKEKNLVGVIDVKDIIHHLPHEDDFLIN